MFIAPTIDGTCLHRGVLARQAAVMRDIGSPFIATVLEAGERQLWRAPQTAATIATWPGDVAADALAMRFNAGLHALARRGVPAKLAALYAGTHDDADSAVGEALSSEDAFIAEWLHHTPQTNEVGRTAAIRVALKQLVAERPLPVELLELGASAGLNLNMSRYAYALCGETAGDPASPVRIAPSWRGAPPPHVQVTIASARGVDLAPLDARDPTTAERLMAYVFADEPARSDRLCAALAIAAAHPPRIDRGSAGPWLAARLAEPQPEGRWRVVFHSMVIQYCSAADRAAINATIAAAGAAATPNRPLGRISFEWTPDRSAVELRLTAWPGDGTATLLATCHPYGHWIDWRG